MLRKRKATQPGSVVSILAGRSGASKGRSSPCSLRCAWLRSRFAPLTRPLLPAELTAGRLQGMVLSVSLGNGGLITTGVLRQRQRATTLGSIWLRQRPSASGAFLGEATRRVHLVVVHAATPGVLSTMRQDVIIRKRKGPGVG